MDPVTTVLCSQCGATVTDQQFCPSCGADKPGSCSSIRQHRDQGNNVNPLTTGTPLPVHSSGHVTAPAQRSQEGPSAPGESLPTECADEEEIALEAPEIRGWSVDWDPAATDSGNPQVRLDTSTSSPARSRASRAAQSTLTSLSADPVEGQDLNPESPGACSPPDNEHPPATGTCRGSAARFFRVRHPRFWGRGRSLFGIFVVNTFLTLLTFGIYSFWGRVRVREFLSSQTSLAGARFAYHGTGEELLRGWLKAVLIFGVPYVCVSYLPVFWEETPTLVTNVIAGLLVLCFIPVAVVGAHRYRMSRTSLRNIRFSFRGGIADYMKLWFKGWLLSVLTLGLYYPYFENARRTYITTHSHIGNEAFEYTGQGKGLLKIYGKALGLFFLTIVVMGALFLLGFSFIGESFTELQALFMATGFLAGMSLFAGIVPWFYLQAAKHRFFWGHTHVGEAQFFSTVTAWKLFELRVGHFVLLITTLGLAWPWVQVRNLQFFYYYLGLHGALDFSRIEQDALDASPTGEELAGFFDTGFDLG